MSLEFSKTLEPNLAKWKSVVQQLSKSSESHVHCQVLPRSQCHDPHAGIFASSQAAVETSRVNGLSQGMKGN